VRFATKWGVPQSSRYNQQLGTGLAELGRTAEAEAELREVKLDPWDPEYDTYAALLGNVLWARGKHVEAVDVWSRPVAEWLVGRGGGKPVQDIVQKLDGGVATKLAFDLGVHGPDEMVEAKPYTVDTFREHRGAVEPTLYLTPSGKWVRRVSCQELPNLKPKPPLYIEVTQPFATQWLWANGYPVPGGAAPIEANAPRSDPHFPS
jgi:hypothetical protein